MRGRMVGMVAVVAVLVSCFLGTGVAERPEGAAVMRLKQQIDGMWDVLNKATIAGYNETVGEVVFYSGGTEMELISGIFAATTMVHPDVGIGSEFCLGIHPMCLYTDEIGFIEWDSCDPLGNLRRIRKTPVRIVLLTNDEIMMIGMGNDGRAVSFLTRQ